MTTEVILLTIITVAVTIMTVALLISLRRIIETTTKASLAIDNLQRDLAPILRQAREAVETANRVAALAEDQIARVNAVVRSTVGRVEEMVDTAHGLVTNPIKQVGAVAAGLRAAWEIFGARRPRNAREDDDENESGMFVG